MPVGTLGRALALALCLCLVSIQWLLVFLDDTVHASLQGVVQWTSCYIAQEVDIFGVLGVTELFCTCSIL